MKKLFQFTSLMLVCNLSFANMGGPSRSDYCNSDVIDNVPDERYLLENDATVVDQQTNLMWQGCLVGAEGLVEIVDNKKVLTCSGFGQSAIWSDAINEATSNSLGGYTDWRLPNVKELATLVSDSCFRPSLNITFFKDYDSLVWSSTNSSVNANEMYTIDFGWAGMELKLKSNFSYIRLVRDNN